jgi:hypothetical protein
LLLKGHQANGLENKTEKMSLGDDDEQQQPKKMKKK